MRLRIERVVWWMEESDNRKMFGERRGVRIEQVTWWKEDEDN